MTSLHSTARQVTPKHEHAKPRPARAGAIPRRRILLAIAVVAAVTAAGCEWPPELADNPVVLAALGGGSVAGRAPNVVPGDDDGAGGVLVDRVYVEARARRGADGVVEVGTRVNATELAWTPDQRLFDYDAAPVGEWWTSSPIGPASAGISTVRIRARRLDSGRIELALLTPTGTEVTPRDPHIAYADLTDSDWAYTTPVILTGTGEPAPPPPHASTATHGGFVEISTKDYEGCGLRSDGTVECWGAAPLLWGTPWESLPPTLEGRYIAVTAPCALRTDGEIACARPLGESPERLGPFVALSDNWGCGIRPDGRIDCWDGPSSWPADALTGVSLGSRHGCGLRIDGTVMCWGANDVLIAVGSTISESFNYSGQARPPEGRFAAVSAGAQHSCGIRTDGTVECWGGNDFGQATPPAGQFTAIHAAGWSYSGPDFTCGLRPGGSAECWGGEWEFFEEHFEHAPPPAPTGVFIALGGHHNRICGLRPGGSVDCWWPANPLTAARRDHFDFSERFENRVIARTYDITHVPGGWFDAVDVGGRHGCGLRINGMLTCWGLDWHGQTAPPTGAFSALSVGGYHSCGLRASGAVNCWGHNAVGQADAPVGSFTNLSAGWRHTCAINSSGKVTCWGDNTHSQTTTPAGVYTTVSAGGRHTCAINSSGKVTCWGDNTHGQTNAPDGTYSAVVAGASHTCALRIPPSDAARAAVDCWGDDRSGQSSPPDGSFVLIGAGTDYTCGLRPGGNITCWGGDVNGYPLSTPPSGSFASLAAGSQIACGLRTGGAVECWIATGRRHINMPPSETATRVPAGTFHTLSAGAYHTCAINTEGKILCWGENAHAQATPPSGTYTTLAGGDRHTCAINTAGHVDCWGENTFGQTEAPIGRYRALTTGIYHSCAINTDGTVECWGDNTYRQGVPPDGSYIALAAGEQHTCALDTAGHVNCWGGNTFEQTDTPEGTFTALTAGRLHTCALRTDGDIDCWGIGYDHDNTNPHDRGTSTAPPRGPFVGLTAGARHTCAIGVDNHVECWPHESQVGGYFHVDSRATPLPGPFTAISAGTHHTCGIRPDQSIDCWSANEPRGPQDAEGTPQTAVQ